MDTLNKKQILIADDHFVVRSGMELMISNLYAYCDFSHASNFRETIEEVKTKKFDLLILDANFPEGNSLSIVDEINKIQPDINILVYTALNERIYAQQFLKLGVKGFLSKLADEEEILLAVTRTIKGEIYMGNKLKEALLDQMMNKNKNNLFENLSPREFEIMLLLIQGEANLEISNRLNIKPSTISTLKNRIYEKLRINNISELIELYNSFEMDL